MNKNFFFTCLLLTFSSLTVLAQDSVGIWKTIDDQTGEVKSLIEMYEKDGMLFGKVIKLFREAADDQNPICTECPDDRKNQLILGLDIVRNMEKDGDQWEDGTICDPESGKVYDCRIWVEKDNPNILNVRGYLYFIYRTQHWERQ